MGGCNRNYCCSCYSGCYRLMRIWFDIIVFSITFFLCCLNKIFHFSCYISFFDFFLRCYFNDFIGSIGFAALCDFLLGFAQRKLDRYWKVFLLMMFCGFVWEVITPLFRPDTVGDIFDFGVYIAGGSLYYGTTVILRKRSNRN